MKKTEKNEQAPRRRKSGGGIKRVVRTAIDLLSFILGGSAFSISFFLMILCVGGIGVGVGIGSSSAENPLLNYLLLSVFTMILTGTSLVVSSVAALVTEYTEKKETMKTSSFFVTLGSVGIFSAFSLQIRYFFLIAIASRAWIWGVLLILPAAGVVLAVVQFVSANGKYDAARYSF